MFEKLRWFGSGPIGLGPVSGTEVLMLVSVVLDWMLAVAEVIFQLGSHVSVRVGLLGFVLVKVLAESVPVICSSMI